LAPATPAADRRSTGLAQLASERFVDATPVVGSGSFVSTISGLLDLPAATGSGCRRCHRGGIVVVDLGALSLPATLRQQNVLAAYGQSTKDGCPISVALAGNVALSVEATLEG